MIGAKLLLILAVPLTCFLSAAAQSPEKVGLTLNGTISSVSRRDISERPNSEKYAEWTYKLLMVLRNDGNQPVIVYEPCFEAAYDQSCEAKIVFLHQGDWIGPNPGEESERTFFSRTYPLRLYAQFWPRLMRDLEASHPPNHNLFIIDPGRTHEFAQSFVVKQKFWLKGEGKQKTTIWENLGAKDGDQNVPGIPLSDASSLRISYRFSPMDPDPNADSYFEPFNSMPILLPYRDPDFLAKLADRWKEFGIFPIDSSGSFSITSKKILNGQYQNLK